MTLRLRLPDNFAATLAAKFEPAGRDHLFSVAAAKLHRLVVAHLRKVAASRHKTAQRLAAAPTGHFYAGIDGSSFSHDADSASVTVPLPGLNRALRDLDIAPRNGRFLTLPVSAHAYGHRVAELRRMGWQVFRPGSRRVLLGRRSGSKVSPVPLYALRESVFQPQDRSLLPTDVQLAQTVRDAVREELERIHAS